MLLPLLSRSRPWVREEVRTRGGQWQLSYTHQMPTSLLLLSIQVSAASNFAEGLLVTFCGVEDGVSSASDAAARTRF